MNNIAVAVSNVGKTYNKVTVVGKLKREKYSAYLDLNGTKKSR